MSISSILREGIDKLNANKPWPTSGSTFGGGSVIAANKTQPVAQQNTSKAANPVQGSVSIDPSVTQPTTMRPYHSTENNVPAVAPQERSVQSNDTVEGRLGGLIDSNSRYIQQARDNAAQQANSRGLINSSIAAGAGEKAAIESALPIAQQDAQTFYDQGKTNQSAVNTFRQNEQAFNMNRSLKEQEQRHTLDRMNVDQVNKENFAKLESQLALLKDNNAANLQAQLEQIKADANLNAEMKRAFSAQAATILDNTNQAIKEIGLSDMSAAQQANAVDQVLRQSNASIEYLKALTLATKSWSW